MGILRMLLALSVLVAHSRPLLRTSLIGGQLAVQSFFMISGFYMALVLHEKYGPGLTRVFFLNRFLRLFPVYFVVLVGSIALESAWPSQFVYHSAPESQVIANDHGGLTTAGLWKRDAANLNWSTTAFLVFTNIATIGQESLQFFAVDHRTGQLVPTPPHNPTQIDAFTYMFVPQAWSIGVELLFYMVAPFIVRRSVRTILALIAASILLRLIVYALGFRGNPWNDRIFPLELAFFLTGALGYKFYRSHKSFVESKRIFSIALMAVTLAIIIFYPYLPIPSGARRIILFASVAITIPFLFSLTRKNRLDRYTGEMSYPFYLTHFIVLLGLAAADITSPLIATAITIAVSVALYHCIDDPVDRFRQRLARRKKHQTPAPPTVQAAA